MEQHRIERLKRHQREHTLIRGAWTKTDDQGRELACLLFALAPEIGPKGDISACPSSVMPLWLARLTPWIDDAPSDEAWEGFITRYAELASRWHVLDEEDWKRLDYAVRAVCLREAMRHTQNEKSLLVCSRVLELCDREMRSERVDAKPWSEAWAEAKAWASTTKAATKTTKAAPTAWAATWAAEAAEATEARTASEAAAWTAWEATEAAATNAEAAAAAEAVEAVRAAAAARKIAADRLVAAILDTIEQAVIGKS